MGFGWVPALALQVAGLGLLWWAAARHERRRFALLNGVDPEETERAEPAEGTGKEVSLLRRLRGAAGGLLTGWTPVSGGVALGLLNVAYFALAGRPWGITTELTYWASALWRLFGHPENWIFFSDSGAPRPPTRPPWSSPRATGPRW